MRITASIKGDLDSYLKHELTSAEKAVTFAIKSSTNRLKNTMRGQVLASGLGIRLAKSWRGETYPKNGNSIKAAGIVYTKAQKIMAGFEDAKLIKGKDGFWLAIPTPNAPKKIMGKKVTPESFEKAKNIKLRFVYRKHGASLLVAENMRASYNRKSGGFSGFRKASKSSLKSGKGLVSVPMFWMLPQVKMPKLINFEAESTKAQSNLPRLILKNWRD